MCFTKHEYQPTSTLNMLCKITTFWAEGDIRRKNGETLSLAEIWLEMLGKNTPYTDHHETFDPKVDQVRLKSANGRGTNFCRPIYLTAESMSVIVNIGVAFQAMNILNSVNNSKTEHV